jgi:hypothetical protein
MRCVWVKAYERSVSLPLLPGKWRAELNHLRPPVDNRLEGTSSWKNLLTGRDRVRPEGWREVVDAEPHDAGDATG